MATRTIHVSLPDELISFVKRAVKGGRYEDEGDVVREALRRMGAAELAEEVRTFDRAFAGGHSRAETDEEIQRVQAGRKK